MEFMRLGAEQRSAMLARLEAMPRWLEETYASLDADAARAADGAEFAPVEQVWHLAELEEEGFGLRIRRLMSETAPALGGFDGAAIAKARHYRERSIAEGLERFRAARAANLATLRAMPEHAWTRAGTQEGIGEVTLCDMPGFMAQHDDGHRAEIERWKARTAP